MSLWNGKPMASGVRDCLHMPAGPMRRTRAARDTRPLTRADLIRLGLVFPAASPRLPHKIVKADGVRQHPRPITEAEVSAILKAFDGGKTPKMIAISVKRAAHVVRDVLKRNGRKLVRYCEQMNPMRPRIVAMLIAGKRPEQVAAETKCALSYVRNIASNLKRAGMMRKEAA